MSATRQPVFAALMRRGGYAANLVLFLLALLTLALVVNEFAYRPSLRLKIDATKTRAYSLSEQTRRLLDGLEGTWTVALITVEDGSDPTTRDQVDQVLDRYAATPGLTVVRVDPTDPASFASYEALLARLREQEHGTIAAYDEALDAGMKEFESLRLFAQQQAGQLGQLSSALDPEDPIRAEVQQRLGLLDLLGREGGRVTDVIASARRVEETQPIPDYETARSVLAHALSQWGDELLEMAAGFETWEVGAESNRIAARFAGGVSDDYRRLAGRLAAAADPLARLPLLEISSIGRQLERGEAAVIIGPQKAAVIPSAQLFPKLNVRAVGEGAVAFDRRFRGEQVISAAIRSLLVAHMPMVVFVHAEPRSLLIEGPNHADLVGVAALLEASRFDVREWSVGITDRPVPDDGQPVVWVIVPPLQRKGLEPTDLERRVIAAARGLVADGEPVLLNLHPSLLPRYRRSDPWAEIPAPFGLAPDTARVVFEATQLAGGGSAYQHGQALSDFDHEHPICAAVHGQRAFFPLPVPVTVMDDAVGRHAVVASVAPSPRRWLEADWATRMQTEGTVERGEAIEEAVPIAVAVERRDPLDEGRQRFLLVGSGTWLFSYVADAVTDLGGGQVALTNPGNQELLLAAVSWLAGMDELIAPSPVSRQVSRLDGIESRDAVQWGLVTVVGAPLGWLALGMMVWLVRRF